MSSISEAAFASWRIEPGTFGSFLFIAILYIRGWRRLQRIAPLRFFKCRLVSFLGGIITLAISLFSPLDAFSNFLLSIHMVQHLLLTMVAPPLLLLGNPYLPILFGLPRRFVIDGLGPFLTWKPLKNLSGILTNPIVTLAAFCSSNLLWHLPPAYELALRNPLWHRIEHLCFLITAILFWSYVINPWPSHNRWPRWTVIPYLLLADLQNTALAAFFSFYDRTIYPTYANAPRLNDFSALHDQAGAGAIMWVPGSIAFLIPCGIIAIQYLSRKTSTSSQSYLSPAPILPAFFTLKFKRFSTHPLFKSWIQAFHRRNLITHFLSYLRRPFQFFLLALAILTIWDGFAGPQISAMNAAGVLPWTHWRGFTVLALLFVGNFFCMTCPFILVRDCFRKFLSKFNIPTAQLEWPRFLRNKWLPVSLIAIYLWAYESFSLWDRPWMTAAIIIGYFTSITLIDSVFKGGSFCKYVCPIGQFHFIQSLASPTEVRIYKPDVCRSCKTFDCIKGNSTQRGCELQLFQPKKSSNMDCNFCLDCVKACPHDNVALQYVPPGINIWNPFSRSSISRWESRLDLSALVLVLTFGAFANAAGMIVPIQSLASVLGLSHLTFTTLFLLFSLIFLPFFSTFIAAAFTRKLEKKTSLPRIVAAYAIALAPLGFGMWLAHFVFHLFTASHIPIPVFQRLFGIEPNWALSSWAWPGLLGMELLLLDAGFLLTLYALWRIAKNRATWPLRALLPWASIATLLYVFGSWIIFQPMEMRGTLMP